MKKNAKNLDLFFKASFKEALIGIKKNEGGPFGAVVVRKGKIVAAGHNTVLKTNDPSCHAEINAIRKACKKLKRPHLDDCILITSSEPCPMCLTTAYWAELSEIYYAVSIDVAASVGFVDDFIYEDLKKKPAKRLVKLIWHKKLQTKGIEIFKRWQKKGGKLY